MKSNEQKNSQIETNQNTKPAAGFNMSVMPFLSKDGEYVRFFLPGEITITEHANRFKGLLKLPYTPKTPTTPIADRGDYKPRLGLNAKIQVGLSRDGEWVTLYLPGNMGRIRNHVNAYKHLFKVPYEKKSRAVA
jgi:hypothetical protein